jgi:uncharacterized protein YchJ
MDTFVISRPNVSAESHCSDQQPTVPLADATREDRQQGLGETTIEHQKLSSASIKTHMRHNVAQIKVETADFSGSSTDESAVETAKRSSQSNTTENSSRLLRKRHSQTAMKTEDFSEATLDRSSRAAGNEPAVETAKRSSQSNTTENSSRLLRKRHSQTAMKTVDFSEATLDRSSRAAGDEPAVETAKRSSQSNTTENSSQLLRQSDCFS